jgi:hypothetical protein
MSNTETRYEIDDEQQRTLEKETIEYDEIQRFVRFIRSLIKRYRT